MMDALQFNIKQVIKVKQSKCYTKYQWVRRLETSKLKKCQNRFKKPSQLISIWLQVAVHIVHSVIIVDTSHSTLAKSRGAHYT